MPNIHVQCKCVFPIDNGTDTMRCVMNAYEEDGFCELCRARNCSGIAVDPTIVVIGAK